jgi:hypothetical protein
LAISLKRRSIALAFVLTSLVVMGGAFYWGATHHPDYKSPRGRQAQARIVEMFGAAPQAMDEVVVGDYVIERFVALHMPTGRFYTGDVCKGRVRNVIESTREDDTLGYTLDLDRRGLGGRALQNIAALVPPPDDGSVYLGMKLQAGDTEAFGLNYDGRLPHERAEFRSATGLDTYEFLKSIAAGAWRPLFHVMPTDGNNFVFTSTDAYPYFTTLFGLEGSLLLGHVELVDGGGGGAAARSVSAPRS